MIYNVPSIYKFGGGGGGYKDGGALVDGDFIKVENNTISSYDNVSRDPVNFYFEVKDGEIINSVIELETDINSTINIYVVKNGFYYLLGNVGGNTVTGGKNYKINIIGDSFAIEEVTNANNLPKYAIIADKIYGLTKIGSLLWTTENLKYKPQKNYNMTSDGQSSQVIYNAVNFTPDSITTRGNVYYRFTSNLFNAINNLSNFRIPTNNDYQNNLMSINSIDLMSVSDGGNDVYGFSQKITGFCQAMNSNYPLNILYSNKLEFNPNWSMYLNYDRHVVIGTTSSKSSSYQADNDNFSSTYFSIRLCMNI